MWIKQLLVAAVLMLTSIDARAQGCCAFGSSLTPTRLDLHERALVGLQLTASGLYGSYTASGQYRSAPSTTTDVELRQVLFVTAAIGSRVQASVVVPWVETYRSAPSSSGEWGHGLGDLSALLRADVLQLHEYPYAPAVAVLIGGSFPTGTPAEEATLALGSDTTGSGIYRGLVGLGIEHAMGSWLTSLTSTVGFAAPTRRAGLLTQHAPRWTIVAAAGYAWTHHVSSAVTLSFETEGNTKVDGADANDSNKRRTELALITTYSFDDAWRAQAQLRAEPPLAKLGVNEPARVGGTLALIWSVL